MEEIIRVLLLLVVIEVKRNSSKKNLFKSNP